MDSDDDKVVKEGDIDCVILEFLNQEFKIKLGNSKIGDSDLLENEFDSYVRNLKEDNLEKLDNQYKCLDFSV